MPKSWFVYIITNYQNTVLYTGVTNDLQRRVWVHKQGINDGSFSSRYKLYKLVWFEEFSSPATAIEIEKKIKGWRREKKIDLIRATNPNFLDLTAFR